MKIDLTEKQFRRLLDLVYVGNWVMNSTRGDDRIREYDDVESTVFANCLSHGMVPLVEAYQGELIPSCAFAEGGIHEAIMAYEDTMFFEILAQELALRDMEDSVVALNVQLKHPGDMTEEEYAMAYEAVVALQKELVALRSAHRPLGVE